MDCRVSVAGCIALLALGAISACSDGGAEAPAAARAASPAIPVVATHPQTGERSLQLRVLTYNVEGLPWPIRKNRAPAMERIGRLLAEMRREGEGPDIVLLQEGFFSEVEDLIERAGYLHLAHGPTLSDEPRARSPYISVEFRKAARRLKGEGVGKWFDSGLYVLSDFPILETAVWPFSRDACAGYDCAANKGVLFASISVPGLPMPLQLFTTHLNAHQDTDVPPARSRAAHRAQVLEMEDFLSQHVDPAMPLIFGGDFNTKDKPDRFAHLEASPRFRVVRQLCVREFECDIALALESERPWLDSQDLQGFHDAPGLRIRPVDARIVLESQEGPERLSDHDGYLVTYELRWQVPNAHAARPDDPPVTSGQ